MPHKRARDRPASREQPQKVGRMQRLISFHTLRNTALRFLCGGLFIALLLALSALGQIMTGTM
jgi:hypothetical protein